MDLFGPFRYKINTNLSARVGHFNPAWNDPNPNEKEEVNRIDADMKETFWVHP